MIPKEWEALPLWMSPMEQLTPEAIELMCDADRRPKDAMETLLIRLSEKGA